MLADVSWAIPFTGLILTVGALLLAGFGGRVTRLSSLEQAMSDRVNDLSRQVETLRAENRDCARRCRALEERNLRLMEKLLRLENGNGDH